MIALLERRDAAPHVDDDSGTLMSQDHREETLRVSARARELIRVAHTARLDLDQNLPVLGACQIHRDDLERLARGVRDRCFYFHDRPSLQGFNGSLPRGGMYRERPH